MARHRGKNGELYHGPTDPSKETDGIIFMILILPLLFIMWLFDI